MTMEIITLGFPIYQIYRCKQETRETTRALAEIDRNRLNPVEAPPIAASVRTRSTISNSGRMYSIESLDEALASDYDGLQVYASCMEFNGENIIFLVKVLAFDRACRQVFRETDQSTSEFRQARYAIFRLGLVIFISLIHSDTAPYPINIESSIYDRLNTIFGPALALIASPRLSRSSSTSTSAPVGLTIWGDRNGPNERKAAGVLGDERSIKMHSMSIEGFPAISSHPMEGNQSRRHIVEASANEDAEGTAEVSAGDRLARVRVPAEFDDGVFEAAFKSIRYVVWTETWQRYQAWKNSPKNIKLAERV